MLLRSVQHLLSRAGISESSGVALGMFITHVLTLTVLCVASAFYAYCNVTTMHDNLQQAR